jgi:hypothetical protein
MGNLVPPLGGIKSLSFMTVRLITLKSRALKNARDWRVKRRGENHMLRKNAVILR